MGAANILIGYQNQTDTGTLSASSAQIAVGNLADYRPSVPWRSANYTSDPAPSLSVLFPGPRTVAQVVCHAHNASISGTVRLRLYSDAAQAVQVYDSAALGMWEVIEGAGVGPAGAYGAGGYPSPADLTTLTPSRWLFLPSAVSARSARLDFTDQASTAGYFQMGRLFIGACYQPTVNFKYGSELGWQDPTLSMRADAGNWRPSFRPPYRQMTLSWDYLPAKEALGVWDDIERAVGYRKPMFICAQPLADIGTRNRWSGYFAAISDGSTQGGSKVRSSRVFQSPGRMSKGSWLLEEVL